MTGTVDDKFGTVTSPSTSDGNLVRTRLPPPPRRFLFAGWSNCGEEEDEDDEEILG